MAMFSSFYFGSWVFLGKNFEDHSDVCLCLGRRHFLLKLKIVGKHILKEEFEKQ